MFSAQTLMASLNSNISSLWHGLLVPCSLGAVILLIFDDGVAYVHLSYPNSHFLTLHNLLLDITTWLQSVFIVCLHGRSQNVIEYMFSLEHSGFDLVRIYSFVSIPTLELWLLLFHAVRISIYYMIYLLWVMLVACLVVIFPCEFQIYKSEIRYCYFYFSLCYYLYSLSSVNDYVK